MSIRIPAKCLPRGQSIALDRRARSAILYSVHPCAGFAPIPAAPAPQGRAAGWTGPLRQRLTALPPPLKGEAGWVAQITSVVTRKREILRCGLRPPLRMTKTGRQRPFRRSERSGRNRGAYLIIYIPAAADICPRRINQFI